MSYESTIEETDHFFTGEDKTLSFEIFSSDGVSMEDVSGWALEWVLRKTVTGKAPYKAQGAAVVTKTTASGITITGTWDSVRATNTQRVEVSIADTDTESLAGGRYVQSLKRTDADNEAVLSHGTVEVLVPAARS
jgi:hypothetical protein